VVIENEEVDISRTQELRQLLQSQRHYFKAISTDTDQYDARGCRVCLLSREISTQLGVSDGDMVEYVAKIGAPLRAWVKIEPNLPPEALPLGPIGRQILNVQEDTLLEIRAPKPGAG
jgi:hypothetical protein